MNDGNEDDWIDAATAVGLCVQRTGRSLSKQILERARDGIVRAKAAEYVVKGPKRETLSGTYSDSEEKRYSQYELPRNFFWAGNGEVTETNWVTGDFSTWIDSKWHCRAYGVKFLRSEIIAMTPVIPDSRTNAQVVAAFPKHTASDFELWMSVVPTIDADKAFKFYKAHPGYNGIKLDGFREEWKRFKGTTRGAQRKP